MWKLKRAQASSEGETRSSKKHRHGTAQARRLGGPDQHTTLGALTPPPKYERGDNLVGGRIVAVPSGSSAQPLAGARHCCGNPPESSVSCTRCAHATKLCPQNSPPQAPPPRDESEYVTVAERPQGIKVVRAPQWRRPRRNEDEGKSTFNVHHDAVQARIAAEVVRFPKLPAPSSTIFQTSYGSDTAQFMPSFPLGSTMCVPYPGLHALHAMLRNTR